jgi:hypothetical protein
MRVRIASALIASLLILGAGSNQPIAGQDRGQLHAPLDELLDLYVRDGLVYYRALEADRRKLDAYIAALDGPPARGLESWPREDQIAFWLNAYNAWVLRAVIDHYPIRGSSGRFPADSLRQVPGVFDKTPRRVAGQTLTLDQIEASVVGPFRDPRLYLALGRGAVGSGRLRSEAFAGSSLGSQLDAVAKEFATSGQLMDIDEARGLVQVTPILSWREKDFVAAYAGAVPARFSQRSDLERALLAFVDRNLLPHERDFLERNDFKVDFKPFDWSLNDLTGGRK